MSCTDKGGQGPFRGQDAPFRAPQSIAQETTHFMWVEALPHI